MVSMVRRGHLVPYFSQTHYITQFGHVSEMILPQKSVKKRHTERVLCVSVYNGYYIFIAIELVCALLLVRSGCHGQIS